MLRRLFLSPASLGLATSLLMITTVLTVFAPATRAVELFPAAPTLSTVTDGGFVFGPNPDSVVISTVSDREIPAGDSLEFDLLNVNQTNSDSCFGSCTGFSFTAMQANGDAFFLTDVVTEASFDSRTWVIVLKFQGAALPVGVTVSLSLDPETISLTSSSRVGAFPMDTATNADSFAYFLPTTVSFDANGGPGVMDSQSSSVPVALSANTFTREGFPFLGWNTAANGSGTKYADGAQLPLGTDVTLYAQWGVTVTFDANGGTGSMATQLASPATLLQVNTFTPPADKALVGWNTIRNGGPETHYNPGSSFPFQEDVTLYAEWSSVALPVLSTSGEFVRGLNPRPITIVWQNIAPIAAKSDNPIITFDFLELGADSLFGECTQSNNQALCTGLSIAVSSGKSGALYLVSNQPATAPKYSIRLMTKGLPVGATVTLTLPANRINLADATQVRVSTNIDGAVPQEQSGYVSFAAAAAKTVTFDANDGSDSPVTADQSVWGAGQLTANTFVRSGYTFAGWNTVASGVNGAAYADNASYSFAADLTLYAQWTFIPIVSKTVTYNANDGADSPATTTQSASSSMRLNANAFTRDGYTFTGWNTAADGSDTPYVDGDSYSFSVDLTLYAQWNEIPPVPAPALSIELLIGVGEPVSESEVAILARGLLEESPYCVTVRSTPQVIGSGTSSNGRLKISVRIPANLEAGWHSITVEAIAADGSPWSDVIYFEVSESGLLLSTSSTAPVDEVFTPAPSVPEVQPGSAQSELTTLAATGTKTQDGVLFGGLMLILGAVMVAAPGRRRHRRANV